MSFQEIRSKLKSYANPTRAAFSVRYFPRDPGEPKDLFYGGTVPSTGLVAKEFRDSDVQIIQELLDSSYHEERLCGLMILRFQLDKALKKSEQQKIQEIKSFYLQNLKAINHWDLVDESAASILGRILVQEAEYSGVDLKLCTDFRDPEWGFPTLDRLAHGETIWQKRISIISQFAWIKRGLVDMPLSICQFHIENHHHYIQKSVGWVLREIGKVDKEKLDQFLQKNIEKIGSICLSYALEKHTQEEKLAIRNLRN